MEDNADRYRQEAERLRREAGATKHDTIRWQLLSLARDYEFLAESVEMIARHRRVESD